MPRLLLFVLLLTCCVNSHAQVTPKQKLTPPSPTPQVLEQLSPKAYPHHRIIQRRALPSGNAMPLSDDFPKTKQRQEQTPAPINYPAQIPGLNLQKLPHQQTLGRHSCQDHSGNCDPRRLPLNAEGKLLSVDGYEVDFKRSTNPNVTNVCGTPRGYVNNTSRSPGCPFTVPCDNPANRDATSTTTKYFQVVWHVMQSSTGGASSNINQARIDDLMAEVNADFSAHNMIFCTSPANFYVDDANYTHDENTEEVSLKTTYNITPANVINIYVVGSMTPGGYARFPYDPMGGTSATGGVVLNRTNCTVGTHTLAHELGHVFGLEHTFAGVDERGDCTNCYEQVRNANGSSNSSGVPTPFGGPYNSEGDQEGDWCSDTHPHDTHAFNCNTSSNPNNACDVAPWNNAPVNNHMSYSFCSSQFTDQQSRRMHCMINTYLSSWTGFGGGICGAQPPVADFVGTPTTWSAPNVVNYTDLSTPAALITTWTWTFDVAASNSVTCAGCTGTDATFVGQNPPAVTYPNAGLYTVSLIVSNANGSDTLTRVDYIEVLTPAGDCDTLDLYLNNPAPTPTIYGGLAPGEHILMVPDLSNSPGSGDKGAYERYITPNPGVTQVGAVRVGLGELDDPDDDMVFQVVVYDDNGAGEPGALLGGVANLSPTQLGVPASGTNTFNEFLIPLNNAVTPTTGTFHVGIEVFPGDPADELVLVATSNATTQGQGNGLNHIFSTGFGYENLLTTYGLDIDLYLVPILGEHTPLPEIIGYTEDVQCDTTFVTLFSNVRFSSVNSMSFSFADGTVINTTTNPGSLNRVYTTPGPEIVTVSAINDCGRADTTTWIIPYNFTTTPDADFTKNPQNPICIGDPVTFTANVSGYADYSWDFGDGTAITSTGGNNVATHTYTTAGLYYTNLDVTALSYQPIDTFYLETFDAGWPAGYQRFDNDPFTPNAAVNPPFTGSNATAWLPIDITNSGENEALSTSFNAGAGQQADDWMLTTAIGPLPANQILSWDAESRDAIFRDGYEVRISTTQLPANVTNYNTLLLSVPNENNFRTTRSINLGAYAGQTVFIAFRNNSTDEFLLAIDNIRVGTVGPGCQNSEQKLDFVEIVDCTTIPPTAALNATPTTGCIPLNVTFTDNTTVGDPATSWVWNFGDGNFSTQQNPPIHTYTTEGSYFVTFQACNAGGCSTDTITIVAGDVVVANAGPNQVVCGDAATLAGNNPAPYTGTWTVVSGSGTFTNANLANSMVTNLGAGANIFEWTIAGTNGCTSSSQVTITGRNFVYGLNGETSNNYCTDAAGWHHFFNAGNEILLSIRGDLSGAPAGFPLITINDNGTFYQQTQGPFTAPSCAGGNSPGEERFEMARSWDVDFGGGALNPPYEVRFYYQPGERTAIETAAANWITTYPACSYTYTYPYPLGFYWFKNPTGAYTAPDYDGLQLTGTNGNASGTNYVELTGITSFSGGSGAVKLSPDPLLQTDWLYFEGQTDNTTNRLRWATESEQNTLQFNIQRSRDGIHFETIGQEPAQGNSSSVHNYQYNDVNPFVGTNYYRLELVHTDGSIRYSRTILLVILDDQLGYVFYPNPTKNQVFYQYEAKEAGSLQIEVLDVLGQRLFARETASAMGINNIPVSLEPFTAGTYIIQVSHLDRNIIHRSKIIKQ